MNDNQVSLVGNIVRTPVSKRVSDKAVVTTFRLASTPRRFDPSTSEWRNLDSLYLTVSCWNKLAERVATCLQGGDPVVVSGRLRMRTYDVEGQKRTVYEVDAQNVAPDLNRCAVAVDRTGRRPMEVVPDGLSAAGPFQPAVNTGPLMPVSSESMSSRSVAAEPAA